jgi:hypothetical protein
MTSVPFTNLTFAIFRKAEFGFFGGIVVTLRQIPLLKGDIKGVFLFFKLFHVPNNAGDLLLFEGFLLGFFIS